jgi:hypothetical protein
MNTFFTREAFMMRRPIAVFGFLSILTMSAASFIVVSNGTSKAEAANATFLLPASDGYGVADCLMGETECGRIVANAWCEAHGFSRADTFGIAVEEVTGSTITTVSNRSERPIAITCEN